MNLKIVLLKILIVVLVIANLYVWHKKTYNQGWYDGLQEGIDGSCKGTWARDVPWQEQVGCRPGDK